MSEIKKYYRLDFASGGKDYFLINDKMQKVIDLYVIRQTYCKKNMGSKFWETETFKNIEKLISENGKDFTRHQYMVCHQIGELISNGIEPLYEYGEDYLSVRYKGE